jgi:hypothetical protein
MIPEIGIMLGLYILSRIAPAGPLRLAALFSVLTGLVTVLVVADLTVRGFTSNTLFSLVHPTEPPSVSDATPASTDVKSKATVTRADGGSVTIELGYLAEVVAKESSLKREWIAVHDSTIPVDLEGTPGVSPEYVYGRGYRYRTKFRITTKQPIRAVEVIFLTFDVWGNHVRSLSFEEVADVAAGVTKDLQGEWALSDNDVERHYASIAYVARVRVEDGQVLVAPVDTVLDEARKFSAKFTAAQLEPKPLALTGGAPIQGAPNKPPE